MRIVLLGNHSVPYSTEAHHAWTWERLGHTVVRLQENQTTTDEVVNVCRDAQLFQYTHTHSWNTPGSFSTAEMMNRIRAFGVKSFSYHLDYYWGLNTVDRRQDLIGQHPSWKTNYWFSTDGAHEAEYLARGVNHRWLPPGVVEYGCYEGTPQSGLVVDVGFAGSVAYHPEYPFRSQLVAALRDRYGARFRVFTGYRERALNDLYASVKVLVGDHVFAGTPRYWSDRLPETCGRGGFIVYPRTAGLDVPVATYEPQNVTDLFAQVDYYLAHPSEREVLRRRCYEHVKDHATYTHILSEALRVMGLS
jgi:hypothetical protein